MSKEVCCRRCDGRGWVRADGPTYAAVALCSCLVPCPECEDSGFVTRIRRSDSRQVAARCDCANLRRRVGAYNGAEILSELKRCTFDTFEPDPNHPSQRQAHTLLKKWARGFKPGDKGWLIHGPVGVGKTHLVCAAVTILSLEKAVSARFIEFSNLLRRLQAAFGNNKGDDLLQSLGSCEFLVIDELGKGRNTPWENDVVDTLISSRYNTGKTTLFTSNHPPEGPDSLMDRLGERVVSRIWERCTMHGMTGDNYRRKKL
ncbi:MAG: ATP-binding protein [Pseudomonadota bacterium]